jgi:hypothetical protein
MLDVWGEGLEVLSDEGRGIIENDTRQTYQKINNVLDVTIRQQEGPDQILQMRVKKLCNQFLAGNKSPFSH